MSSDEDFNVESSNPDEKTVDTITSITDAEVSLLYDFERYPLEEKVNFRITYLAGLHDLSFKLCVN